MKVCPCRHCTDRQCGCHAKCEKYKGWRKEYDDLKEEADKKRQLDNSLISYTTEAKHRIYKHCNNTKK